MVSIPTYSCQRPGIDSPAGRYIFVSILITRSLPTLVGNSHRKNLLGEVGGEKGPRFEEKKLKYSFFEQKMVKMWICTF